ncbi:MAG TPA: hypothetical protein VK698_22505 [Kofleriaceae bacterium]|nr:hypothetical protein [Kofleriaceae bacterium]
MFCPRLAVVMNARARPGPANTMSEGSSPTRMVRTTRGGLADTSTTLTLSDRWLTTQASPSSRRATASGSSPTATEVSQTGAAPVTSKISRRASGVFTAYRRVPSEESARGRDGTDSNDQVRAWARAGPATSKVARRQARTRRTMTSS